jgi:Lamin Tail Domain/CHU_C Type IX secretion signal domain/Bacterial Ig-like domain
MRICLTLLLFAVNTIGLTQFSDDFGDGDFSNSPTWLGQTSNFMVNTSNELQLNAPATTDTSYLSLPTTNINNTTWDFYLRMDFNPSSSNFTRVYLVSDNSNLKGSLNGYFVMLGGTTDEISLYRQDGTTTAEIIDGVDDALNFNPAEARVRVTRDAVGNWEVFRDTTAGFAFFSEGTVLDATYTSNANFGVFCRYTSTRSTLFYFDDLGDPYVDTNIPTLDTAIVISSTQLDAQYSEPMDQVTAETLINYSVDQGIGSPSAAVIDVGDPSIIHLTFLTPFVNGTSYVLTVNNVQDVAANSVTNPSTANFTYVILDTPVPGEVRITEFVADPSPPVGLPEVEYVEIYNTSAKYFDLVGWTISDGASNGTFNSYILGPNEHLLICNTGDCGQFFVTNSTELSLPSLNNSGDNIILKDNLGTTLDSITYDLSWYNDVNKEAGGWSLERKFYDTDCNDAGNWGASLDAIGGTPALINSIWTNQPDQTLPFIQSFSVLSDTLLEINFNEFMDTTVLAAGTITPSISPWGPINWIDENTAAVYFNVILPNVLYEFVVSLGQDCWGNQMATQSIFFGIPDSIGIEDIILNEVMFNPLTNGSDYVELYNNSNKIIDLSEVYLANWDDSITNYKSLVTQQRLLLPAEYVLITEDTNDIKNDFSIYGIGTFIEADIPTYPNDSGTVYLISKDFIILDFFHYDEDFQFELLSSDDGKALERISFDGQMNNPDNWHTASELVEWGTPGYENSQLFIAVPNGSASIDPKIFSPDNDGYQDVITISLDLQTNDNVVDVEIFDNQGRLIRLLKDNLFVGNQATLTWDGINDEGEKAGIGTYVILISVVDINGNQEQYKLAAVLAGKLE